ncbi:hypothetical protein KCP73_12160 [Salmonella enterica subsp. enterica]|nr:hypothetical protein KCP73_12160 [Salmonella enterica subsp. enterica]
MSTQPVFQSLSNLFGTPVSFAITSTLPQSPITVVKLICNCAIAGAAISLMATANALRCASPKCC